MGIIQRTLPIFPVALPQVRHEKRWSVTYTRQSTCTFTGSWRTICPFQSLNPLRNTLPSRNSEPPLSESAYLRSYVPVSEYRRSLSFKITGSVALKEAGSYCSPGIERLAITRHTPSNTLVDIFAPFRYTSYLNN